jgi:hypothetical protein
MNDKNAVQVTAFLFLSRIYAKLFIDYLPSAKRRVYMNIRKYIFSFISIFILALLLPLNVHAETYGKCGRCNGTGICELCDPSREGCLGNGVQICPYCHQTGYIICGTNHTGDGTPIGCDGSGYNPDGSVCMTCGGAGKYPCDACFGSGFIDCKCKQAGMPGVCMECYGTGWRLLNSVGQGINTTPVYPTDGSTISFVEWGRDERHTYDASRYGMGTSPDQYMQIYSGGGGGNSSQGEPNDQGNPEGDQGDGLIPGVNDGPPVYEPVAPPDFYNVDIRSDEDLVAQIHSDDDMIYFICTHVCGEYLFSVQAVKSNLSQPELDLLYGMTAEDIADFKARLQTAANGMEFTEASSDNGSIRVEFQSGPMDLFPFMCDVLIELPINRDHAPAYLYNVIDGKNYQCMIQAEDPVGDHEYLIFSLDRLGEFVLTTEQEECEMGLMPSENRNTYDHNENGATYPGYGTSPGGTQPDAGENDQGISDGSVPAVSPQPEAVESRNSILTMILCIIIGAVIGAGAVIIVMKKKK